LSFAIRSLSIERRDVKVLAGVPLSFGESLLDRAAQLWGFGLDARLESGDDLSIAIDQEFGEIPRDRPGVFGVGRLAGQELIKWVNALALDDDLGEQWEADLVVGAAELLDLVIRSRLLGAELVGREGEDLESLILVLLIDLL